jgi:hypothetical protein
VSSEEVLVEHESKVIKVGGLFVSMDPVLVDEIVPYDELWVGAVFSRDGRMVEGPVIQTNQSHARAWVDTRGRDDPKRRSAERPGDDTTCTFKLGQKTFFGTATRAKVIAPFPSIVAADLPEVVQSSTYEVEIVATFTHLIQTSIDAIPGLTREQLESKIDEDFPHLGSQRGMLVDLAWELESYEERPGLSYRIQPKDEDPGEPRPRVTRDR